MNITVCDICQKQPTKQFSIDTGETQTDAAGGPSESIHEVYDLCFDHTTLLLDTALSNKTTRVVILQRLDILKKG